MRSNKPSLDELKHYGIKRKSGRYPWGSGEDPHQGESKFLGEYETLLSKGFSQVEIANKLGMNTTQLRDNIRWARAEQNARNTEAANRLKDTGLSNVAIGKQLGVSEATVRNYLSKKTGDDQKTLNRKQDLEFITDTVKSSVEKTGYLDVGVGVERQIGVSRDKFNAVVNKLAKDEGYYIHEVSIKRLSDPTGQKYTTVKVLTKDPDKSSTTKNSTKIRPLDTQVDENGEVSNIGPPVHVDLKRIKVRYAEEGGADKDGLIELRPGVEDLDLGNSKYAQVRIAAGDNLYLKGMAAYSPDKFPNGVDIIFNTNKKLSKLQEEADASNKTPKELALKKMKEDIDNPFGANITKQKGSLNIVNEQGDWDTWSTKMSSQFLSKQPLSLIKDRLEDTYDSLRKEFDEIDSMTNPEVRRYLMESYIAGLDSKARHLKAKGLPRTKNHVLLPITTINPGEIFAPLYNDGERVVLVRHPHGGKFEIPDLVVNNKNPLARKVIGKDAPDAVGIHPSVASKLSGADFDGDTALVIPNNNGQIKTSRSLKELKNFEPNSYKVGPDSPVNIHVKDPETGKMVNTGKTITPRSKQREMGVISNLITDMTIKDANDSELARAVKHSMVVIDAEKHNLDYKQSARDNSIAALKKKYQTHINPDTGKQSTGASTLISRSKRLVDNLKKNKLDITDPSYDPDKYSSRTAREDLYANYINRLKKIKNESTKTFESIPRHQYSKDAAKAYENEVKSLNAKLNTALLNAPRERQAQILTNHLYYSNVNPDMDKDDLKKLKSRSLARARNTVGAKKSQIKLEAKEWEAIQSGAISATKLKQILDNADMDIVRKFATPRIVRLSASKIDRARAMFNNGKTPGEVAQALGVSTKELREAMKED